MATKPTPTQTLAKAVGGKAVKGSRNERIILNGKKIATVWTRGNGALAVYVDKDVKIAGQLKKATEVTSEGLRLRVTREDVELGDLVLARELVGLARDSSR